jgi:hypothetical protein
MKVLQLFLIWIPSSTVFADCSTAQNAAEIDLNVILEPQSVAAGGHHGMMDQIVVSAPAEVAGLPLVNIELTRGVVEEFWIPLAFKTSNTKATAVFWGYQDAVSDFEISIHYDDGNCHKSLQKML